MGPPLVSLDPPLMGLRELSMEEVLPENMLALRLFSFATGSSFLPRLTKPHQRRIQRNQRRTH